MFKNFSSFLSKRNVNSTDRYPGHPGLYVAAEMKPEWTKMHFK